MNGTSLQLFEQDWPLFWPEDGLKPHRFAGIFRMLSLDEKALLDASVKAKGGLINKIKVFNEAILDGRNRYMAIVDCGLFDPATENWRDRPDLFEEFVGSDREALDLVWSLNEERRHDEKGERAMAAARRKKLLDELAASDPSIEKRTDEQLAAEHGVSERLLNSANQVIENATPEVKAAVDAGAMSVTDAADVSRLPASEQRIIVETVDRKVIKEKVKAATKPKQSKLPNMPDLPSPMSRTALATFAEEVALLAQAAAKKHKGKGASISADAILDLAIKHEILERGEGKGFTRPMLLVLGRLRDTMPGKAPKADDDMPTTPPLGGEWSLKLGAMRGKCSASIAVFHEEDETFSISVNHKFPTSGASSPFEGSYPSFRDAIVAAGNILAGTLDEIAARDDSVTTETELKSAYEGLTWLEKWFTTRGLPRPEAPQPDLLSGGGGGADDEQADDDVGDHLEVPAETYARLVEEAAELKGRHSQKSAEPIIRAAEAAGVMLRDVEADIGHSRKTIGGWRRRLGLQQSGRRSFEAAGASA